MSYFFPQLAAEWDTAKLHWDTLSFHGGELIADLLTQLLHNHALVISMCLSPMSMLQATVQAGHRSCDTLPQSKPKPTKGHSVETPGVWCCPLAAAGQELFCCIGWQSKNETKKMAVLQILWTVLWYDVWISTWYHGHRIFSYMSL